MIRQALEQGAVAKLLISEGMRKNVVDIKCNSCSMNGRLALDVWTPCQHAQIVKQMGIV